MKKLDIKTPVDISNIDKLKSEAYDRIISDPIVHKYIKENEIPLSFVNDNLGLFLRMEQENKPCLKCKGYQFCKKEQVLKGYITYVESDESISYKKCSHYEDFLKIADSYVYRDFPDEDVFIESRDLNLIDPATKSLVLNVSKALKNNESLYISSKESLEIVSKVLIWATNQTLKTEHKVAFINASSLRDKIETLNHFDKDKYFEFENKIKTVDVLIINGLGNEESSNLSNFFKYTYLMDLFSYRQQHGLLTFVSSYYSLKELKEVYSGYNLKSKTDLLIKKINEHVKEIVFNSLLK